MTTWLIFFENFTHKTAIIMHIMEYEFPKLIFKETESHAVMFLIKQQIIKLTNWITECLTDRPIEFFIYWLTRCSYHLNETKKTCERDN